MLLLFLFYLIITSACLCWGFIFYRYLHLIREPDEKPFIFYAITGLISLILLAQILALFTPVNIYTFLLITTALCIFILLKYRDFYFFFKYYLVARLQVNASLLGISPVLISTGVFTSLSV